MFINRKSFLLVLVIFSTASYGVNIRWKHPSPSTALLTAALKEAQEIRDIDGGEISLDNLSDLKKLAADEKQADFFLATINSDLTIYTKGFTRNQYIVGLGFPENFTKVGIAYKPTRAFAYQYQGKIKGATFSLPHMTHADDSRDDMVLHTEPLSPFTVIVLYQDGTTAQFNIKSKKTRKVFGGGFSATQLDYFDGKLWLDLDKFQHYYVGMPYSM